MKTRIYAAPVVKGLMELLSVRMGFNCSITLSGSSNEGTRCGLPNEFDFHFCLEEFPEHFEPRESDRPGFATFSQKQNLSNEIVGEYNQFTLLGGKCILPLKWIKSFATMMKITLNTTSI